MALCDRSVAGAIPWSRAQFFVSYFAQGVQRVGKDYLRTQASAALGGDVSSLQLFYNLLPEFGSLPWTLKPLLMFLAEQNLSPRQRVLLAGIVSFLTASAWAVFASSDLSMHSFLLCTALVSLGSAIVDGLVDGRVAEESVDSEAAAQCRFLCECGSITGGLLVGLIAWAAALGQRVLLLLTALAWAAVAPLIVVGDAHFGASAPRSPHKGAAHHATADKDYSASGVSWRSLFTGRMAIVSALSFVVCLCPTLDFFLFRQHRLGLTASEQSLVSVLGSCGWFLGVAAYRNRIAHGRSARGALQICLMLWPLGGCLSVVAAAAAGPGTLGLMWACAEKVGMEFCKALTFMPCMVLMQLACPSGCASTAFTLMQCSGTVGCVLARNLEFACMAALGVDPKAGAGGFERFTLVAALCLGWRLGTVTMLCAFIVPKLTSDSSAEGAEKAPADMLSTEPACDKVE
mmetsp:Transcript_14938/g.43089  ORF Transcript_14938/g.43089 Transcript_14938/m.43089 type:complete len:460 (-) Transcript_14938:59-1438(-)|eukprot:CAMPEP_0176087792 /NCGR_PEP_ID=MMETSP0120_2-20121206/43955_1 /TAXON_ID=160619 /ORGANISM="Kryptoperidinium foliaceum, Strain CCMP 1326" /LENGTH=459 /DNA_ID=CAMNT_0017421643 /DNA_START=38 /DNA_END=1417 /DNA_ORIENTATION=-